MAVWTLFTCSPPVLFLSNHLARAVQGFSSLCCSLRVGRFFSDCYIQFLWVLLIHFNSNSCSASHSMPKYFISHLPCRLPPYHSCCMTMNSWSSYHSLEWALPELFFLLRYRYSFFLASTSQVLGYCHHPHHPHPHRHHHHHHHFGFWIVVFQDRISLYNPGCSGTHSLEQVGLKLRNLPASSSQSAGITGFYHHFPASKCWD